jgi:hypothetical protein
MGHRKELHQFYESGQLSANEFWELRAQEEFPELIKMRSTLYKPLGQGVYLLGPFSLSAAYIKFMHGDSLDTYKKEIHVKQLKSLKKGF